MRKKLTALDKLRKEHKDMPNDLYSKIRRFIKSDFNDMQNTNRKLIGTLPPQLRADLSYLIHKEKVQSLPFFRVQSQKFIGYISQFLTPAKFTKGNYIYEEGDEADCIYFITKGKVGYILKDSDDLPFLVFDQGKSKTYSNLRILFWRIGTTTC
jgi:hypothetical protein